MYLKRDGLIANKNFYFFEIEVSRSLLNLRLSQVILLPLFFKHDPPSIITLFQLFVFFNTMFPYGVKTNDLHFFDSK